MRPLRGECNDRSDCANLAKLLSTTVPLTGNAMPQSLAQVYLHVVFSTKHRQPFLRDEPLRRELHDYLGGACRNMNAPSLRIGGVEDHVHILCRFSRTLTIADFIAELKRESSKWIKTKDAS